MISPNSILGKQFQLPVLTVNPVRPAAVSPSASAPTFDASSPSATQGNPLLQTLASLQQTLSLMTQKNTPALDASLDYTNAGGGAAPAAATSGGGLAAPVGNINPNSLANTAIQRNNTANPLQRNRLNDALAKVANDPEGSRLLQAALANGYTIEVGDPSAAIGAADSAGINHDASTCSECQAALDGGGQINGVTIPGQKKIVVNPNAPDFEKTLVHELVHAATEADGNSKDEEGKADLFGYSVSQRITGRAAPGAGLSPLQQGLLIYNSKKANPAYANLQESNGVDRILNNLGLFA